MGVPALFRWLSKKYPKIVLPVAEEQPSKMEGEDGTQIQVPVDISGPNPNDVEFDNLYLDMNGIVHPCTHPEGKPAPETEAEMMLEIFSYTERVVNMVRPRKLLFMAIDGVAPRAKMNQQRSRRFRAAQEAKDKAESHEEALRIWKSMGQGVDPGETKEAWDSNAITPGTPFMDLLAASLRYWVVRKLNTDPGWEGLQVYISDASVPGEGEHKIMDFIRRQRVNKGHDANTKHVIYGLDADLIMLSLATHEPNFRVLREDVFQQGNGCRKCGQDGHYANECTNTGPMEKTIDAKPKPFIFLDVAILREYLEVELNVSNTPFPFNFEHALDDWVLLIFFVGNDFLPHLPSLEIREGAIDTLLKIWKQELPRMGGYLTDSGQLRLKSVQIILEGLASREDEIFRKRREAEERSNQNQRDGKRRRVEVTTGPSPALHLSDGPKAPGLSAHPSLPARPDFAQRAKELGFAEGQPPASPPKPVDPTATQAVGGSNRDVVANRAAIRMANMDAAQMLKAELAGLVPLKPSKSSFSSKSDPVLPPNLVETDESAPAHAVAAEDMIMNEDSSIPGLDGSAANSAGDDLSGTIADRAGSDDSRGHKRTHAEVEEEDQAIVVDDEVVQIPEEDEPADGVPDATSVALGKLQVQPDGSVVQDDTVKLWEPGYRERYYRQKFGVEPNDEEFRKSLVKSYVEGMAWVLHYYFQGTPSWHWYYPHHFAPFAADFKDIDKLDITFEIGQPFKPYEQLMGVFPAASKVHIPDVFHHLMTDEDSPIIDFYPETFEIDMNGKKMIWQGVALLPFIDEHRLLEAMAGPYKKLTEDQIRRNDWGKDAVFVGPGHALYPEFEALYGKRAGKDPVPMNPQLSGGINGSLVPNPECIPGSTYYTPLDSVGLPDIPGDRSICAYYYFPKQLSPHRSVILPAAKRMPRSLTQQDLEHARRRAGNDDGGGRYRSERGGRGRGMFFGGTGYQPPSNGGQQNGGGGGRGRGGRDSRPVHQSSPAQPYSGGNQHGGYGGGASYDGYGAGRGGSHGGRGGSYGAPAGGRGGYGGGSNYGGGPSYGGSAQYGGQQTHAPAQPYGGPGSYGGYGAPPAAPPRNDHNGYGGYGGYGGYQGPPGGGYGGSNQQSGGRGGPRGRGRY